MSMFLSVFLEGNVWSVNRAVLRHAAPSLYSVFSLPGGDNRGRSVYKKDSSPLPGRMHCPAAMNAIRNTQKRLREGSTNTGVIAMVAATASSSFLTCT